jgi:hypothetical protein
MSLTRTYTVKIEAGDIWQFKYNLNGYLIAFNVLEGSISKAHSDWLFVKGKFPYLEEKIKDWQKNLKQLTIEVSDFDLSFENIWKQYNLKVKRDNSEKAWNKLSDQEKIKCFLRLKKYNANLATNGQAKAHLVTWINQKRFNDED